MKPPRFLQTLNLLLVLFLAAPANAQVTVDNRNTEQSALPISVSSSGAATQAFPIAVPAGVNGIQPGVSLVYSSGQYQDILGVGWMLDLGSIEINMKFGTPAYTSEDLYVLKLGGGQIELVYDNTGGFYRAKTEGGFFRVEKVSDYWVARDRQGTKYTFGMNTDARCFDPNSTTHIFRWHLERVEDIHGNYMTVTYEKDADNKIYPRFIDYTGNTGYPTATPLQPYAQVEFSRGARLTPHTSYAAAFKVKTTQHINEIIVRAAGNVQRRYQLTYTASPATGRDLLTMIQPLDSAGIAQVPPVQYTYFGAVKGFTQDTNAGIPADARFANASNAQDLGVRIIDINGDAFPDLIRDYVAVSPADVYAHTKMAFINNKDNTWSLNTAYNLPGNCESTPTHCATFIKEVNTTQGKRYIDFSSLIADLNGDGYNDLLVKQQIWEGDPTQSTTAEIDYGYTNTSNGWTTNTTWLLPNEISMMLWAHYQDGGSEAWWLQNLGNVPADVNNDGWIDFVLSNEIDENIQGVSDVNSAISVNKSVLWSSDGKIPATITTRPGGQYSDLSKGAELVDLNGDGLPDIYYNDGSTVKVYMNTGTGWTEDASSPWGSYTYGNLLDNSTKLADVNGDGLTDLIVAKGSQASGSRVLINSGNGWIIDNEWIFPEGSFVNLGTRLLDADADTLLDFMVHYNGNPAKLYINEGSPADLLSSVENNYGGFQIYAYGSSSEFDQTFMPFAIPVISQVTRSNNMQDTYVTAQKYENGLWVPPATNEVVDQSFQYPYTGNEFRGFGKVSVDGHEDQYAVTEYHQDYHNKGRPSVQRNYDTDENGTLLSETIYTYATQAIAQSDGIYFPHLDTVTQCTYNASAQARCAQTDYDYSPDGLGNIFTVSQYGEVDIQGNDLTPDDDVFIQIESVNNTAADKWILGLPRQITLFSHVGGVFNKERDVFLYYDDNSDNMATPVKGLLTKVRQWAGAQQGAVDPETTYVYNGFGNILSFMDPNNNDTQETNPKSTVIAYDTQYGIFPVSVTNPLDQTATAAYYGIAGVPLTGSGYNGLWGQTKSVTDENGRTQTLVYDDLGRTTAVISPEDSLQYPTITYEYLYGNNHMRTTTRVRHESGTDKTVARYDLTDGLNRLLYTKTDTVTPGQFILSGQAEYDSQGRVINAYLPRFTFVDLSIPELPGPVYPHSASEYDALGRPVKTTNADGTWSDVVYDRWTVESFDENGHKRKAEFDAFGRVVNVAAFTGSDGRYDQLTGEIRYPAEPYTQVTETVYDYAATGELKSVTNEGLTTTIAYDQLGRRKSISDPSMGTWAYEYDLNGNVLQQLDNLGQDINFTYDKLNRPKTKTHGVDLDVSYTYDQGGAAANAVGRLTEILTDGVASMTFGYDDLGRQIEAAKVIGSNPYQVDAEYNALDNVTKLTYPNNEEVHYAYNVNGQVVKVANGPISESNAPPATAPVITATSSTLDSITVTWTYVDEATGYNVHYAEQGTSPFTYFPVGDTNTTVITGLDQDTTYDLKISAFNDIGEGPVSTVSQETTLALQLPAAPTGVTVVDEGDGYITVQWNAVTGAQSYSVKYRENGTPTYTVISGLTGTTKQVSPLTNDTQHFFIVSATANGLESADSTPEVSGMTYATPAKPVISSVDPGNTEVTVNWSAVAGADSYEVIYGTSAGNLNQTETACGTTSCVVDQLTNYQEYHFAVIAYNGPVASTASDTEPQTPVEPTPAKPLNVSTVPGDETVTVSWDTAAYADTYIVKWGTTQGVYTGSQSGIQGTSYPVPNLTNDTQYYFVVSGVNQGAVEGPESDPVSGTPTGQVGYMDITLDTTSEYEGVIKSSFSHDHTVTSSGSNRVLVVAIETRDFSTTPQSDSVTYGGQSLTLAGRISESGYNITSEIWYLLNPPTGTNSIQVTLNTQVNEVHLQATSLLGVNQQAPEQISSNSGTNLTASVDVITSTPGAWVIDAFGVREQNLGEIVEDASQTLLEKDSTSFLTGGSSYKVVDPAGSISMQWTQQDGDEWAILAAAFAPAPLSAKAQHLPQTMLVAVPQQGYDLSSADRLHVSGRGELMTEDVSSPRQWRWSDIAGTSGELAKSFLGLFTATEAYADEPVVFDFTSFTDEDPQTALTQTTACIAFDQIESLKFPSYVYKAVTTNGDFIYEFDTMLTASDSLSGETAVWGISGTPNDTYDNWSGAWATVSWFYSSANIRLRLDTKSPNGHEDVSGLSLNTRYYIRVSRSGSTITLDVYSDAQRSVSVGSVSRTWSSGSFDYLYGFSNDDSIITGRTASGDVCNMQSGTGGGSSGIDAPTLNVAQSQDGQVYLEWTSVQEADSYKVFYTPDGGSQSEIPDINDTFTTVPNLVNGTNYTFSVAAVSNTLGESDPSNELTAYAIGTPTLLSASPGDGFVDLDWTTVTEATNYDYYYEWQVGGGTTSQTNSTTGNISEQSVSLTNDTEYTFKVRANIGSNQGVWSGTLTATPSANPVIGQAPVVSNSTPTDTTIQIQWGPVPNASDYEVKWGTTMGGPYPNSALTGGATQYTAQTLPASTTHYFTVRAFNTYDTTGMTSTEYPESTLAHPVPGASTLTKEFVGNGRIGISWTPTVNTDYYVVSYGTTPDADDFTKPQTQDLTDIVDGLTNGQPWYIKVISYNQFNQTASDAVSDTPMAAPAQVYVENVKYNEIGQKTYIRYGNGVVTEYEYYPFNYRLKRIHTVDDLGADLQDMEYEYDGVGNITKITNHLQPNTQTFAYDALGRMVQAVGDTYGTKTYVQSDDGNLYQKGSESLNYGENMDPEHAVTSTAGGKTFTYDENGNMTGMTDGGVSTVYVYDVENRLETVTENGSPVAAYAYDESGERVSKTVNGLETRYVYPFYEENSQEQAHYVVMDGVRVARLTGQGQVEFIHTDHLGSHQVTTDESANVQQTQTYLPFGEFEGTPPGTAEGPKYTGQHYDAETGLYYYGARYYNPNIGRFLTADSIVPNPYNAQSFNRYSYVINNPLNFVDPTGYAEELTNAQLDSYNLVTFSGIRHQSIFTYTATFSQAPVYGLEGRQIGTVSSLQYSYSYSSLTEFYLRGGSAGSLDRLKSDVVQNIDGIQLGLEGVGTVDPTPIVDSVNAGIYAARGRYGDATASAISAVPYLGDAIGKGGKYISIGVVASIKQERVFWSGGKEAMDAARKFAEGTDRVTLEMTKMGVRLENAKNPTQKGWIYASRRFAEGAEGVVHVFRKAVPRAKSVWKTVEEPILRNSKKIRQIIEHIIE